MFSETLKLAILLPVFITFEVNLWHNAIEYVFIEAELYVCFYLHCHAYAQSLPNKWKTKQVRHVLQLL